MINYHVICCNDAVEYVIVTETENSSLYVINKLKEIKEKHFEILKKQNGEIKMDDYESTYFWHIHTIDGEININSLRDINNAKN